MDQVREQRLKAKTNKLTKEEFDNIIYELAMERKDAPAIKKILESEYGIKRKTKDFIYNREGWKKAQLDLAKLELNE